MSSVPQLLNAAPDPEEINRIRREMRGLEQELRDAKDEATRAKQASSDAITAIRAMRKQLEPLFLSLKILFGEISRVDAEAVSTERGTSNPGILSSKMEMIKKSLGGRQSEFIDCLAHGPMTIAQLVAATKCAKKTGYDVIYRLTRAGLIDKVGGNYSLKEQ
jgi:hypothetical protein